MLTVDGRSDLALGAKHNSLESTMNGTILPTSPTSLKHNPRPQHRHMWVVTGPAGCGKSTVAASLSTSLSIPYLEGDDYHPPANRLKMSQNIPLTDMDRWDWLITLRDAALLTLSPSCPSSTTAPQHTGVVVTCSALKRKYRDVIRVAAYNDHGVQVHFIYLHADEETLLKRVMARKGHYMGAKMVHSQFESLEEPGEGECGLDVLRVDCRGDMAGVERRVLGRVRGVLEGDL